MYKTICPRCGAENQIVNQCRCDPDNLPTRPTNFFVWFDVYVDHGRQYLGCKRAPIPQDLLRDNEFSTADARHEFARQYFAGLGYENVVVRQKSHLA